MLTTSLRTQVILPRDLRARVDRARAATGESLAAYLRLAINKRLAAERLRRVSLTRLADEVVGADKKTLTKAEVVLWQRQIRRDRL